MRSLHSVQVNKDTEMKFEVERHPKWPVGDIVASQTYGKYTIYEIIDEAGNSHFCCGHLIQPYVESLHGLIDHMEEHLQYFEALDNARRLKESCS